MSRLGGWPALGERSLGILRRRGSSEESSEGRRGEGGGGQLDRCSVCVCVCRALTTLLEPLSHLSEEGSLQGDGSLVLAARQRVEAFGVLQQKSDICYKLYHGAVITGPQLLLQNRIKRTHFWLPCVVPPYLYL